MKRILQNAVTGQDGVAAISKVVSEMGYIWYPTGGVEAGIDGFIELRDSATGEVRSQIIAVQSKSTTKRWPGETENSFHYICEKNDIDYWMGANLPILLVVTRSNTKEAYWVSIREYFSNPTSLQKRVVEFDKKLNRFDAASKDTISKLAIPKSTGLFLPPQPRGEQLVSNLLPIARLPETIYVAETEHTNQKKLWETLRESNSRFNSAWYLSNGMIVSFNDLRKFPWTKVCFSETCDEFATEEWSDSPDSVKKNEFVMLLNRTLNHFLERKGVRFDPKDRIYYFRATSDMSTRSISYQSLSQQAIRDVFAPYYAKKNPTKLLYWRHSAFKGQFLSIDGSWYLQINPTYRFTRDGRQPSLFAEDNLKGIKKLEKNNAVVGQVLMWASFLQPESGMFAQPDEFLEFGSLEPLTIEVSVNEEEWIRYEDEEPEEENASQVSLDL